MGCVPRRVTVCMNQRGLLWALLSGLEGLSVAMSVLCKEPRFVSDFLTSTCMPACQIRNETDSIESPLIRSHPHLTSFSSMPTLSKIRNVYGALPSSSALGGLSTNGGRRRQQRWGNSVICQKQGNCDDEKLDMELSNLHLVV